VATISGKDHRKPNTPEENERYFNSDTHKLWEKMAYRE
jgi:hypothetical protein